MLKYNVSKLKCIFLFNKEKFLNFYKKYIHSKND